jgi:hypothetical protein
MRRTVIPILVLVGLACGSEGGTEVQTTSGPTHFAGSHAVFFIHDAWVGALDGEFDEDGGTSSADLRPVTLFRLVVSDAPWACWLPDAGLAPTNRAELSWSLTRPKPAPIAPGEYPLGGTEPGVSDWSDGQYLDTHPGCIAASSNLIEGKLNLSSPTAEEARGFVTGSLPDGTRLEGEFEARHCPPPPAFDPAADAGVIQLVPCAR